MCDCITRANEALKSENVRVVRPILTHHTPEGTKIGRSERVVILTERIRPRERRMPYHLVATYCPFCGVKYANDEDIETVEEKTR